MYETRSIAHPAYSTLHMTIPAGVLICFLLLLIARVVLPAGVFRRKQRKRAFLSEESLDKTVTCLTRISYLGKGFCLFAGMWLTMLAVDQSLRWSQFPEWFLIFEPEMFLQWVAQVLPRVAAGPIGGTGHTGKGRLCSGEVSSKP